MKRFQNLSMFQSATLRLTGWYVLLLMVLSLLFSAILFTIATDEFNRALGPRLPGETHIFIDDSIATTWREQRISDSNTRLLGGLALFNVAVLVGGTAVSYWLARRTLQPIEKAHTAQSRFASDAAHELRTPLAVMQAEIEVGLRDKKATKQDYEMVLESSLEEVERLRNLTDQLLQLASQQELEIGSVNIEDVIVEAVTQVVPLAQTKHISVENNVATATVTAHAPSITSVIVILLDNAIKYSPEKSHVIVESKVSDKWVSISVIDQGCGIAPEEQEKVFERFYRADSSRSKEHVEGHGLGLSLAKRLIEEMHGELLVTSALDQGATFTVRLPKLVY